MSNTYVAVTALIFAIVALVHALRIFKRWPVLIGPLSMTMEVSWFALGLSTLLAIWGFAQFSY
jgi:hypothetical protein